MSKIWAEKVQIFWLHNFFFLSHIVQEPLHFFLLSLSRFCQRAFRFFFPLCPLDFLQLLEPSLFTPDALQEINNQHKRLKPQ